MDTLNSLYAIHKKLIKMLVDTVDVLADLSEMIAKEMKKVGVKYIG